MNQKKTRQISYRDPTLFSRNVPSSIHQKENAPILHLNKSNDECKQTEAPLDSELLLKITAFLNEFPDMALRKSAGRKLISYILNEAKL